LGAAGAAAGAAGAGAGVAAGAQAATIRVLVKRKAAILWYRGSVIAIDLLLLRPRGREFIEESASFVAEL